MPRSSPTAATAPTAPAADRGTDWVVAAYREYARDLWGLLGRLGVPAANIEDVIQEVFLVLHRRRDEFRHESSLRTWLHGIAVNLARRDRERRTKAEQPPQGWSPEPPASPESVASHHQAIARLDRLLSTLSDEQREAFVLADIAELPVPEIATSLGINLNTVYSRLRLARAAMQRAMQRLQAEEGSLDGTT